MRSNSLYVNKVPLDFLCSPSCFIHPFLFPLECCIVSEHTQIHTHTHTHTHACAMIKSAMREREGVCLCVRASKCPFNVFTRAASEHTVFAQLQKNISTTATWWNFQHNAANLSSASQDSCARDKLLKRTSCLPPRPPWDASSEPFGLSFVNLFSPFSPDGAPLGSSR